MLVRATDEIEYPTWTLSGDAVCTTSGVSFTVPIIESPHSLKAFRLRCRDDSGYLSRASGGGWSRVAPQLTATAPDGSWKLTRGTISENTFSNRTGSTATITFSNFEETRSQAAPAITMVVYSNAPATGIGWPDQLGDVRPEGLSASVGLYCKIFGRNALLRSVVIPELAQHGGAIVIAWTGPPFKGSALRVIITVLSFVFGTQLVQFLRRTVDEQGNTIQQTVYALHESYSQKPMSPIHLYQPWAMSAIGKQLDTMFKRCRTLFVRNVPLDVAVLHLLPPHDSLGAQIRDVALALETLVMSPMFKPPKRKLVSRRRFIEIRSALEQYVDSILTDDEAEAKRRIMQVLQQANDPSVNDRRNMFWKSLGMQPTVREIAALQHRDTMSHLGYVPFQHGRDGSWNRIVRDMNRLRTLVNRVIFRLLGYNGHVKDYTRGGDVTVDGIIVRHKRARPKAIPRSQVSK